jgi:hypothetical protein
MMRKQRFITCGMAILGSLFLLQDSVKAGTVIDQDMVDVWGRKSGLVLFYSEKKLRIDQKDGKLSTIMDFKKNRIVILDHASKTYVAYPFSVWEKRVSQDMATKQKAQKKEIRIEATGAEKVINGFQTRQIQVFMDDFLFQDNWVTQEVNLEEMLETIKKGVGRLSGFSKTEIKEKEEIYRKINEWGFPILTTEYRQVYGKTLKEITKVARIEARRLNGNLFTPPKGYTQRPQ